jgi:HK97 family phage prohead protease
MRITRATSHQVEIRSADGKTFISGYAARFFNSQDPGTEYDIFGDGSTIERVMPGAFRRAITEKQDVRALFNHKSDALLGRIGSGTLILSEDNIGLRYDILIGEKRSSVMDDVITMIERGDLAGSSFGFRAKGVQWSKDATTKRSYRALMDVDLFDVGPVINPAYGSSTAGLRSADDIATEHRAIREEMAREIPPCTAPSRRYDILARLVEIA